MASVRDYLVQEAIDKTQDLVIWCEGKHMVVPWAFLTKKLKVDKNIHQSKFSKKSYKLIDFRWKAVEDKVSPDQAKMFE